MVWARKALLAGTFFVGSFFAGLQVFGANSANPPVARPEPSEAKSGDPAPSVDIRAALEVADYANRRFEVVKNVLQNTQPAAPAPADAPVIADAFARAIAAMPKSTTSLFDRVRQAVLENKTEETERLGLGDFAYQDVPNDGSIMVGMEVSYAPFFNHNIIKSVRPIFQKPDGTRYYGAVCGNPTGVGERIVAREGYAIGGAAIKAGMGIDGMQLTFMEIGANGLNPDKTYLSKWLGINAGSGARMFVNDGRPIIGIAGMRSKDPRGPAFCMCLVTTRACALANSDACLVNQKCTDIITRSRPNARLYIHFPTGGITVQYCPNWDNWGGLGDKWFLGDNSRWYYVLPNGNLYASPSGNIGPNDSLLGNLNNGCTINPVPPPRVR